MDKTKLSRAVLFCLILILSLATVLYYGSRKEGYHVDELYSYGLANSEYLPFMHFGEMEYSVKDWMKEYGAGETPIDLVQNLAKDFKILKANGFHIKESVIYRDYLKAQANSADTKKSSFMSGQAYRDYLGASKTNRFNYASVYYNQRGDVHPPLFYMALHTVCSFFPGSFTKWYGLAMNLVIMGFVLWTIWRIAEKFLGGSAAAALCTAVYGLSCGFVTTAIFLRMYALLTLMVLLCLEAHLRLYSAYFEADKKLCRRMFFTVLLGYLTHYYFVLYALMIAFVCCVMMVCLKKWRSLFRYILTMGLAALTGLIVWPFSIKHVFLGYRGKESLQILGSLNYSTWRFGRMLEFIDNGVFGTKRWLLYVFAAILLIGMAISLILARGKRSVWGKGVLLTLPVLFYFATVSQIVPFFDDRYVLCTYPFVILTVLSVILYAGKIMLAGKMPATKANTEVVPAAKKADVTEKIAAQKTDAEKAATQKADSEKVATQKTDAEKVAMQKTGAAEQQAGMHIAAFVPALVAGIFLVLCNNSILNTPGYLYPGGQETITVPDRTVCIYVLPDGDWNESANETNVLAKCEKVAVVYESDLESLQGSYRYEDGQTVMVVVRSGLDADNILSKVRTIFELETLTEISRSGDETNRKILLERD